MGYHPYHYNMEDIYMYIRILTCFINKFNTIQSSHEKHIQPYVGIALSGVYVSRVKIVHIQNIIYFIVDVYYKVIILVSIEIQSLLLHFIIHEELYTHKAI